MNQESRKAEYGVEVLGAKGFGDATVGLVLGSGLRSFADALEDRVEVPYAEVPHWPEPRVEGHGGSAVLGSIEGVKVACLTGRVHLYEGWAPADIVRAVRTLRLLGIGTFVLTNAAGGIQEGLRAGDLMRIVDHLNLTGATPLGGPHEHAFGPRFADQSAVWDAELGQRLEAVDGELARGVYAGLPGPSYETPAEVRMLRTLGADAVGMSTVHEAMALNAMGAKVAGVSLISNLAAGISPTPLCHDEVVEAGLQAEGRLTRLLSGFCRGLAD